MRLIFLLLVFVICTFSRAFAQTEISIDRTRAATLIAPEIYGQFAEHLGGCIYGGLWVGPDSSIPNERGYRKDVLEALKKLKVPVLRWPGGCFADDYHWRDGIGARQHRPKTINIYWGNVVDDNSFGTHEFLDLCELLGCEAYVAGNVGSGTVEEMREWVEYMTSDSNSTMAELRRANGREKPWRVKYFGVGNENWGCGGNMTAQYYSDLYRRYATYVRNFSGNKITKVANGPSGRDVPFMDLLIRNAFEYADAFSMHYYVLPTYDWGRKGNALNFPESEWFSVVQQTYQVEELIEDYISILDEVDPEKKIALYVDEWGTWYDRAVDTKSSLFQQNTIRDAISAALFLHVFHDHADRVKMGNIAQVVNVLQAMILTNQDRMLLTPTYHVFEMYNVHQGSKHIPLVFNSPPYTSAEAQSPPPIAKKSNNNSRPGEVWTNQVNAISATASLSSNGTLHVSLVNADPTKSHSIRLTISGDTPKNISGLVLTSEQMDAHNTFDKPDQLVPRPITSLRMNADKVEVNLPAKSISTISIR